MKYTKAFLTGKSSANTYRNLKEVIIMSSFEKNLSEGNVAKQLVLFSLPFLASNIIQSLYSVADMLIVGRFSGTTSMSGVNLGSQVTLILTNIVVGLCAGGTVLIAQYLGVSDCKLQEGSMRADVNLSLREVGATEFGTRTEMKNLNSFKAIRRAIEGETERQMDLLDAGEKVVQETRRWDDNAGESYAMRSKEDAQDYRYFPDPDLVPIVLSDEFLEEIRSRQPEFRNEKRIRYREEFGIPDYDIEIITGSKKMADLFEQTVALGTQPKKVSNWLMGETLRILKEKELDPEDIRFSPEHLSALIALQDSRAINGAVAKEVFEVMFEEDMDPVSYVEEKGLKTVNDEGALRKTVEEVIANNPQSVEDYHNGKEKAIGFLVGQTMKAMKGKCDPGMVNQLLKELL